MKITYENKIIEKPLHSFYEGGFFGLPEKLEEKNYAIQFYVLKIFDLVRNFVIYRYKLTSDYISLLEEEQFDEN